MQDRSTTLVTDLIEALDRATRILGDVRDLLDATNELGAI